MNIGMLAMQKKFDELSILIQDFQNLVMKIKTSKIPVVVSTQVMFLVNMQKFQCIVMLEFMQLSLILV